MNSREECRRHQENVTSTRATKSLSLLQRIHRCCENEIGVAQFSILTTGAITASFLGGVRRSLFGYRAATPSLFFV